MEQRAGVGDPAGSGRRPHHRRGVGNLEMVAVDPGTVKAERIQTGHQQVKVVVIVKITPGQRPGADVG